MMQSLVASSCDTTSWPDALVLIAAIIGGAAVLIALFK